MDMACKSCDAKQWVCIDDTLTLWNCINNFKTIFFQYNFMGNVSINNIAPFQITYKFDNESRNFQADTKKCNESYPVIENHSKLTTFK